MYSFEATPYMILIDVLTVSGEGEGFVCIECYVQQDAVHTRLESVMFESAAVLFCSALCTTKRRQESAPKEHCAYRRGDFHPMDLA